MKLEKYRTKLFRVISGMANQSFDGFGECILCGPAKKTLRGLVIAVYQYIEWGLIGRKKAF